MEAALLRGCPCPPIAARVEAAAWEEELSSLHLAVVVVEGERVRGEGEEAAAREELTAALLECKQL